ncbi:MULTISPECIES: hypothetical protein [Asaia]|uniref:hypothetical protein n=1 Tax=Asaia TaxID=91914 RepID=UPI002FC28DBD
MTLHSWIDYAASFITVIALIFLLRFAIVYLQPRLGRRHQSAQLGLVESLSLDSKRRLSLFRCQDRTGLILTGGETDLFLGWVAPETDTTQPETSFPVTATLPETR